MVQLVNKFRYNEYQRVNGKQGRCYQVDAGRPLPSVTTVLSKTGDKQFLDEWRKGVGEVEAERIVKEASSIGSRLHLNMENYILHGADPAGTVLEKILSKLVIDKGLVNVSDVWGTEVGLYTKDLYAGTTDLIAVHKGQPSIIDFKNSRGIKKRDFIEDYFLQLAAYAESHNEMFGTDINKGVIMMACRTGHYLEFIIEGDEFESYRKKWYERLYRYYEIYGLN